MQGHIEAARGETERLEGRLDEGRLWARRAISTYASIRNLLEAWCWDLLAAIEESDGNLEAALAALERADRIYTEGGEHALRSTVQARFAVAYARLGDYEAAGRALERSEQLSAPEDMINYAQTHAVRAQLALREGDAEAAERWGRSAVDHAFHTDFPSVRGAATLAFAEVMSAVGRTEDARAAALASIDQFDSKGDRPGVAKAQSLLDSL